MTIMEECAILYPDMKKRGLHDEDGQKSKTCDSEFQVAGFSLKALFYAKKGKSRHPKIRKYFVDKHTTV